MTGGQESKEFCAFRNHFKSSKRTWQEDPMAVDADMEVWESHEKGGRGKEELLGGGGGC